LVTDLMADGGTLSRGSALLPTVMGLDDLLIDRARRRIRQEIHGAVRRVAEIGYEMAMREVSALKDDLAARLAYIASLPNGLREQVAYEAFAAGFDHYLPKKLLRHYVWGRGGDLTLTKQEMIDCNPHINLTRSKAFRDLLDKAYKQHGKPIPFELGILSGALTNGTLGQFTAKTKGELVAAADGSWTAKGTMSFYDEWDFDPKDFATGGRSLQGELKTRVANSLLPGQGFKIYSLETDFQQSQADATVVWAGGAPVASPDRIAALDIELSKPDK
jgi:hypothetical protein